MAVTVKKVVLWRKEVDNRPGTLAGTLAPLAQAGGNLRIVMGYALPGESRRSVIEVFPVTGKKATEAAGAAGLAASPIPCLLVEGDDQPGLGARMTRAVADQGVNLAFLIAETVGRRFSAVFGFESDANAARATPALKAAARPARPAAKPKRKAAKKAPKKKARRR
jgi:hypothetical protein